VIRRAFVWVFGAHGEGLAEAFSMLAACALLVVGSVLLGCVGAGIVLFVRWFFGWP